MTMHEFLPLLAAAVAGYMIGAAITYRLCNANLKRLTADLDRLPGTLWSAALFARRSRMTDPIDVTVTVLDRYHEADDGLDVVLDGTLDEVIASIVRVRDSIPEPFRAAARIEFVAYDECFVKVRVQYSRPETADETAGREKREATQRNVAEAREREMLAHLKAKFEPKS